MTERVRLFISVTPDLEAEREAIGQAVAELPIDLGWVIKTTPTDGRPAREVVETVDRSHIYVLLLGADITAPVGLELAVARRSEKVVLAYRKRDVMRTPAAQVFQKDAQVAWVTYTTVGEMRRHFQEHLVRHLLERAVEYRLQPEEYTALQTFLETLQREEEMGTDVEEQRRGAGGGGVIISRTRDIPQGGVLVRKASPPGTEKRGAEEKH